MPFTTEAFIDTRPFLFHLTDRNNLDLLRGPRKLLSAASLMRKSGDTQYLRSKRHKSVSVQIGDHIVIIRDQQPLHAGNIGYDSQWTFEDVVFSLNERIFLWPGTAAGPISYGVRHFERYAAEQPVILRVPTSDMFDTNSQLDPQYCRYNSGSPRCSNGRKSPRGPNTFVMCSRAGFTPSKVVEVTFSDSADLPASVEISNSTNGPWVRL